MNGVSIEFLASVIKALERLYGPRLCGPEMNGFLAKLRAIEQDYQKLELDPKAPKKKAHGAR